MGTVTAVPANVRVTSRRARSLRGAPIACALLALIGIVLSLFPQADFVDLPREWAIWGTFGILLCLAAGGYAAAKAARQSPWIAPISLISIYYFVRYGWGTVVAQYWENYPWQAYPLLRWNFHRFGVWQYLPGGCQLMIVFGVGMLLGSLLALTSGSSGLPRVSWPFSEERLKRMAIVFAPIAAFINSGLQFALPTSIRFTVGLFGSIIYPLTTLGAYWLFSAKTSSERVKWTLFLAASWVLTAPVGLITGQVNGLLMPGVAIVLGYIVAKGSPPWKALTALLPIILLVLLPLSSLYKNGGSVAPEIGQRVENTLRRYAEIGNRGRVELALERSVMRFSGANMPSLYARFFPSVFAFEFGKSFEIEASTIVPRILWPKKPFGAYELNRYPARIGIVAYEGNTTALFDAPSEYYVNFGTLGMFILAIVHGYYWQALYKWLALRVQPLIGAVLILTLIVQNEDFYGVGMLFTAQIKILPVWLLLLYFLSREQRLARR
jgi:hypothetical protein